MTWKTILSRRELERYVATGNRRYLISTPRDSAKEAKSQTRFDPKSWYSHPWLLILQLFNSTGIDPEVCEIALHRRHQQTRTLNLGSICHDFGAETVRIGLKGIVESFPLGTETGKATLRFDNVEPLLPIVSTVACKLQLFAYNSRCGYATGVGMPMNPITDLWLMRKHLADWRYSHAITIIALSQLGRDYILLREGCTMWYISLCDLLRPLCGVHKIRMSIAEFVLAVGGRKAMISPPFTTLAVLSSDVQNVHRCQEKTETDSA